MAWWHATQLTLILMAVTVVLSGLIGILGAWAADGLSRGGRVERMISRFFVIAMVAALALPLVLHAAAWESTAGKFGWLPLTQTGSRSTTWGAFGAFGGLLASGWIHGLYGAAIVGLATLFATRRTPIAALEEAQLTMGPTAIWWRIQLPIAKPWVLTALIAAAAIAATEMTVVDLYGYLTVADVFYRFNARNVAVATVLFACYVPLAVLVYFLISSFTWRPLHGATGTAQRDPAPTAESRSTLISVITGFIAIGCGLVVCLIPLAGLVIKAGHQVSIIENERVTSWSMGQCLESILWAPGAFGAEYLWTAVLAGMTGVAAILLAWPCAAMGRSRPSVGRFMDLVSCLMFLVPGPLVGLAVVGIMQWPLPGFRFLYEASLFPSCLALCVKASPVAYWILRVGYRGLDDSLLQVARMDSNWFQRMIRIDGPLLARPLAIGFLAAAMVASGDVPALIPIIPPYFTTVGTRLFELLHNGSRYQEAALALWYVGAIVACLGIWQAWELRFRVRMDRRNS